MPMIGGKAINWYCAACDERIVQVDFAEQVRAEERERIVKALESKKQIIGDGWDQPSMVVSFDAAIAIVRGDA
jgi:hypothetical protein